MKNNLSQEQFQELYNQFLAMMNEKQPKKRRPRKRPNGSGTINFLGKGRSRPWQPIVTLGYDEETGKQIRKALPTCETREQAQEQLDLYNLMHKGYVTEGQLANIEEKWMPTFAEIFERALEEKESNLSKSTIRNHNHAFGLLQPIHNLKMNKIDLNVLQPIFDSLGHYSESVLKTTKNTLNMCFKYAIKYDFVEKNYSSFVIIKNHKKLEEKHRSLTKEEIKYIHNLADQDDFAKTILIYVYTGLRATELLELDEINLHDGYIVGGKKTKAGKRRIIPIHETIKEYLIDFNISHSYWTVQRYLKKFNQKYNTHFTMHDFRHTFATLCIEYGVTEYYAKCILGHSHNDITKDVYTHANTERLKEEINKIPIPPKL